MKSWVAYSLALKDGTSLDPAFSEEVVIQCQAASHSRTWIEVAIGATACAGFVALTFVVDHESPVVEGEQAPKGLIHGRRVLTGDCPRRGHETRRQDSLLACLVYIASR